MIHLETVDGSLKWQTLEWEERDRQKQFFRLPQVLSSSPKPQKRKKRRDFVLFMRQQVNVIVRVYRTIFSPRRWLPRFTLPAAKAPNIVICRFLHPLRSLSLALRKNAVKRLWARLLCAMGIMTPSYRIQCAFCLSVLPSKAGREQKHQEDLIIELNDLEENDINKLMLNTFQCFVRSEIDDINRDRESFSDEPSSGGFKRLRGKTVFGRINQQRDSP